MTDHEPISPELVLVDPELARRERALLPHPGEREALARIAAQLADPQVAAVASAPSARPPRTRSGRRWPYLVAVGTAFVTVAVLADVRIESGKTPAAAGPRQAEDVEPIPPLPAPAPPPPPAPTPRPAQKTKPAPPSPQRVAPTRSARRPAKPQRRPAQAAPQSRSFAWAPAPGATGYHVELFRGDTRVFSADTRRPAITIPATWQLDGRQRRLAAGEYRWYVWPVVGGNRRDQAIVQAELTVSSP